MSGKLLRTLVFLFSANTISGFAQGITMLAIPWFIIQLPNGNFLNPAMVGLVTFASLFWGLYAGTLVDRFNRKHIFLSLCIIDACILLAASGYGFQFGQVPFWLMVMVYTATIFTYNVHYPNLYAFVQELFEPRYYARVNSAIEIQGQTTNFLGMMTGGILIDGAPDWDWWPKALDFEAWSMQEIFLLDASTYVLGFALISLIPYQRNKQLKIDTGSVVLRLRQGFQYLNRHREIFLFGVASHVIFFSLLGAMQVINPVYVKDYLKETASILASFKGVYALGAISAGLLALSIFVRRTNLIRQIIFLLFTAGFLYEFLGFTKSIPLVLTAAFLLGIANAGTRILRITYLVRLVPNRVIGRVNSIFAVINVMMRVSLFGMMALPFFSAEGNGANSAYAFVILGIIMFLVALILIGNFNRFNQEAARGD